jgi:hypothetical protein
MVPTHWHGRIEKNGDRNDAQIAEKVGDEFDHRIELLGVLYPAVSPTRVAQESICRYENRVSPQVVHDCEDNVVTVDGELGTSGKEFEYPFPVSRRVFRRQYAAKEHHSRGFVEAVPVAH